jgi:hypothetical protein
MKKPLIVVSCTRVRTVWRLLIGGKVYFAITYPDSDLLTVETEARRSLSSMRAPKLHESAAKMIEEWRAGLYAEETA